MFTVYCLCTNYGALLRASAVKGYLILRKDASGEVLALPCDINNRFELVALAPVKPLTACCK